MIYIMVKVSNSSNVAKESSSSNVVKLKEVNSLDVVNLCAMSYYDIRR